MRRHTALRTTRFGLTVCVALWAGSARADRIVLAPQGSTLAPNVFKAEFSIAPSNQNENLEWLQFSTPDSIEMEVERTDIPGDSKKHYSFNLEYPVLPSIGRAPSVAVGVRDLLATGTERDGLYAVLAKSVALSDRQYRFVHSVNADLGFGTGRLDGPFVGMCMRLATGLNLNAEVFQNRMNVEIGVPLLRGVQARTYSLNGRIFYGLSAAWNR